MNDLTDQQLLRDYVERHSETAFTELVHRHVDLIHSAAVRLTNNTHSAQDITQAVFVALAQNAAHLQQHPVITGWLHTAARNLAAKNVRAAVRRQNREQEAIVMNELISSSPEASWEQIRSHLDVALGELNDSDLDAVLLRYFEKKTANEIADRLGITDDAAQKRVSRAVEKLREFFSRKKITIGAGSLGILISANAVQSAPLGLAVTISAAALGATAVTSSTIIAATKTIAMTTLQKTLVTVTVAALAGAGIYEARQAAQLRDQVQTLQQQQTPLAEQLQQLQREYEDMTNRLAGLLAENSRLKANPERNELLKLRGEIGRVQQNYNRLLEENQALQANAPSSESTNEISMEDRAILLKKHATDTAGIILDAIRKYASENGGRRPEALGQLLVSGDLKMTNFAGNLTLNDFELAAAGFTNFQGKEILLYLHAPIRNPGDQSIMVEGGIAPDGSTFTEIHAVSE